MRKKEGMEKISLFSVLSLQLIIFDLFVQTNEVFLEQIDLIFISHLLHYTHAGNDVERRREKKIREVPRKQEQIFPSE